MGQQGMSTRSGKGHTDGASQRSGSAASIEQTVHDLRNALAGVRGAIQIVREPMRQASMEREILGEVLDRFDHMDELLLRLAAEQKNTSGC
jgi:nitrogen-specific signal transduction histidine kinase